MRRVIPAVQGTNYASIDVQRFDGGYVTSRSDIDIGDTQLSGGNNVDTFGPLSKRQGHTLYGDLMGGVTDTLGLIRHNPEGGTQELLAVYDTKIKRYVAGIWTDLTDVTMTTNKRIDYAHYPITNKTYIVNGTDNVVKYASGTAGVQTDSNFKKGSYIVHYKNRLLVAVGNVLWYTDLGVDTFSADNFQKSYGDITGLHVLWDRVLTFTKNTVYYTNNFAFDGVASGPEQFIPMQTNFGAIYDRTIKQVGRYVFWLGQDSQGVAAIYRTDGYTITKISNDIDSDLANLAPASLTNACAGSWGQYYRLSVTPSGETTNTLEYIYDSEKNIFFPPYTNELGGFSCYENYEVSGELMLFAGTQGNGQVYQLNRVDYDEIPDAIYTSGEGTTGVAIDANPAKRAAQSFKLTNYTEQEDVYINSINVMIKKNSGTTTDLQLRIETDNNGNPSGTLAHANATATISAFTSTAYSYKKGSLTGVTIKGNTTYWLVAKHATEGSGDSKYLWSSDNTSPTYSNGNLSTYLGQNTISQTFNPDSSPETTSVDGMVSRITDGENEIGESFSNIVNSAGTTSIDNNTNSTMQITASTSFTPGYFYRLDRIVLLFDTSSMPSDAIITSATLSFYAQSSLYNHFNQSIGLTSCVPTSNTSLVSGDYDIANFGSTRFANDILISSILYNTYTSMALNASGISNIEVNGISKFALRFSCDIDNTAPTIIGDNPSSDITIQMSENTNKPRLVINYTTATGASVWTSDATQDLNFAVYAQGNINGWATTKAFLVAPQGQRAVLKKTYVNADASGEYKMQVGLNTGEYAGFINKDIDLSSSGKLWGSTMIFGQTEFGGKQRASQYVTFNKKCRTAKIRFGNKFANQPFQVNGFSTRERIKTSFK